MSIKTSENSERIANSLENIEIHMATIAESISQLLDFISIINFDELAEREEELRRDHHRTAR